MIRDRVFVWGWGGIKIKFRRNLSLSPANCCGTAAQSSGRKKQALAFSISRSSLILARQKRRRESDGILLIGILSAGEAGATDITCSHNTD